MSKERKFKAEIVFESDETRILRNKIRRQEELDQKNLLEREQERKRKRRISNQKKFKKYQSKNKRIAFSNQITDRFHTLKKKYQKSNSQFLTILLDNFEQSEKRKEKEKEKKTIINFIKIDEKTKFYLFPLDLLNSIHNKRIRKIKENNINHCCKIETINEEENTISIYNPSNTMNSNCVSKMDLKVATSIFLSGLGYCEYIRLFSMLFEEDSLMCSNTFYSLQRSYIIPTIKEIWKRHQKFLIQKIQQPLQSYVDGRWSRSQKEKGIAEYLTEVLIDSVTHLVLGIETLCKDEKEEGKGNEEAQCLLKMLESPPIKDLKINELICDENKSVIKRIKEAKLPLEISLCIGHKGNTVRKKWRTKCKLKKTLSKNQLTKQGKKRKKPLYVYTHRHLEDLCKKIETHFKVSCSLANNEKEFIKIWVNFSKHHFGNHKNCFELCQSYCLQKERKEPLLKTFADYLKCHNEVYIARTYLTALNWNFNLLSGNPKRFVINKQLERKITNKTLESLEKYHFYGDKNETDLVIEEENNSQEKKEEKSYKLAKKRRRKNKSKKEKEEDTRNEKVNMAGELDQNL
ncbi:hypothetical protein M0813_04441 [Anaeramoeba flamelloides]|uniref:K Homology domain-containing protein n=1 Tax=Anaeramoeba flamelloides TaxID=1746091 RepID=A0ABQ8XKB8_9EUKA|nr:hypothetical protein M0813_04441 [Anaeramoeba flamelloides]